MKAVRAVSFPHDRTPLKGKVSLPPGALTSRKTANGTEAWVIEDSEATLSRFGFIINIVADILPPGFLPLAFALKTTGIGTFIIMLFVVYVASVFTMWCCGCAVMLTGERTWRRQWEILYGKRYSWIPVMVLIIACFFNTLLMSCFSADIFESYIPFLNRWQCLLIFTAFPLAPLSLVRDLSGLTFTSALALAVLAYTAFLMCLRAWDGSYAEGGQFASEFHGIELATPTPPPFHVSRGTLDYLGYLVFSFLVHYNGCKFFRELHNATTTTFVQCTALGMGITACAFGVMGIVGYQTFGMSTKIAILTNYSNSDMLATISSLCVAVSLVLSYPLMFVGLREASIELVIMIWPDSETTLSMVKWQRITSLGLVAILTFVSLFAVNIEPIVTLTGCTCGVACVYIIPCVLCASAMEQSIQKNVALIRFMRGFAWFSAVVGLIVTINTVYDLVTPPEINELTGLAKEHVNNYLMSRTRYAEHNPAMHARNVGYR